MLALNLYLKLPFGKLHSRTPEIIHLANLTGRSPNAVAMRLSNYANVDPYHQGRGIKGLDGGRKQVEPIWNEYVTNREDFLFESERILAERQQVDIQENYLGLFPELTEWKGEDLLRQVKTRVNQGVFRQMVLVNYGGQCAITGIDVPELLIASHIIPWAISKEARLNPENGLCLSPLFDRAFDKGLIGVDTKYTVRISKQLQGNETKDFYRLNFADVDGVRIKLPEKYLPRKEFLEYHLDVVYKG